MTVGVQMIADERDRQINEEGHTPNDDLKYDDRVLPAMAACYALAPLGCVSSLIDGRPVDNWPAGLEDKREKHSRLKRLTIAGALIAAEIDRLLAVSNRGEPVT